MRTQIKDFNHKGMIWSGDLPVIPINQVVFFKTLSYLVVRSYILLDGPEPIQMVYVRKAR